MEVEGSNVLPDGAGAGVRDNYGEGGRCVGG